MSRGEVWWADLREPSGSEPGFPRPTVVVSDDRFDVSRLRTVVVVGITGNTALAAHPGNVLLTPESSPVPRSCVVNVTQVATVDRCALRDRLGELPA